MAKKKSGIVSVQAAANRLKIKRSIVDAWIEDNRIGVVDGGIAVADIEKIKNELEQYVTLKDFLDEIDCDRFDARFVKNRNAYMGFLEENDFFGMAVKHPSELCFLSFKNSELLIPKKDINRLKSESVDFFKYYGLDKREETLLILSEGKDTQTKKKIEEFISRKAVFTPTTTEFVRVALTIDSFKGNVEELREAIDRIGAVGVSEMIQEFIKTSMPQLAKKMGKGARKKTPVTKEVSAYPLKTYCIIAKSIFNKSELEKNNVLKKCLEDSFNFECWLFLAAHYVCAWRAEDICNNWPIPDEDLLMGIGVDLDTLKDNLLQSKIEKRTLAELGRFVEVSIVLASRDPHKVKGKDKLVAPIGEELREYFGLMALIASYHQRKTGEGRLKIQRLEGYLNYLRIRNVFGNAIYEHIGRKSLHSKRLSKSFIQSIEIEGRMNGYSPMMAHEIAAYARNHASVDTTIAYLRDHGLSGETAEVVLALMMDRGVFGAIVYKTFLLAFPDAFARLSPQEQTKLLAESECSAYEIEMLGVDKPHEVALQHAFAEGKTKQALTIIREMFEISQGVGAAKDEGVYCKKRALGLACKNPTFESCIANACPYLIFTQEGIRSLINVLKQFDRKHKETGNPKYLSIVKQVLLPEYKDILAEINRKMSAGEQAALKKAIEVFYNEP